MNSIFKNVLVGNLRKSNCCRSFLTLKRVQFGKILDLDQQIDVIWGII